MTAVALDEASIFNAARRIEGANERSLYVQQACGGDTALSARVLALLRVHLEEPNFLASPPPEVRGANDDSILEGPGSQIGPYKLVEPIGEGGFGIVFMAEQRQAIRRTVALKIIKPGMDTRQVVARFEAERQALALMDHPHIARILDGGQTASGRPYFVMELVKGVPITRYCDENQLTPRERLNLFVSVCEAVQHAHQKGIIHRDLKPTNVLVAAYDGKPVVKVIDFGVAKALGEQLTQRTLLTGFGGVIGTLEYMSPEQAEFNALDVDTRTDIYSLGVLLYELLTGTTPLTKERLDQTAMPEALRLVREEEPPKPSTRLGALKQPLPTISAQRRLEPAKLTKEIRGDLDWIVMKALEKDRNRRYETASSFAADVQRHLSDEPVHAGPPSARYRFGKFLRRHRTGVLAASLVLLALVGGMIGTILGMVQARVERQQAEDARADATAKAEAEREARQARELMLADTYTSFGVAAAARDDPRQAVLWFAHAARLAGDDPERANANCIRAAAWGRLAIRPIRAVIHPAEWIENNLAFHPNGWHLLTHSFDPATEETTCRLWDLAREVVVPFPGDSAVASAAAWDFEGKQLAVGTPQGDVSICRFPGGELCQRVVFAGRISRLLFSPDGRYCALAAANRVRVWDCRKAGFATPEIEHPAAVETLVFDRGGELLATGCKDATCRVFAVPAERNTPLFTPVSHGTPGLRSVGLSPIPPLFLDKGAVLLTLIGQEATLRDPRMGRPLRLLPFGEAGSSSRVTAVTKSGDDKHFLLAARFSGRPDVRIYAVDSGQAVSPNLDHRALQPVWCAAFSPDGQTLLTGSGDHTARLWSVPEGKPLGGPLTHPTSVNAAVFAPDARRLVTAQRGGLIRLWALPAGNPRDYRVPGAAASFVRLSRDGRFLLLAGLSRHSCELRRTQVFELATGQPSGPPLAANGFILDAAFSPDGLQVAAVTSTAASPAERQETPGQQPGQLHLWDWRSGALHHQPLQFSSEPRRLDYSPDGRQLAVITANGELIVLDPATGQKLRQWQAHSPHLENGGYTNNGAVRFSPDNRRLLTFGTFTNSVRVWDAYTGQFQFELKHKSICNDVQFSPDGRLVATAATDNQVCVWELATGRQLTSLAHPDWTFTALFSPDGNQLLTACRDGMARLWDWRAGRLVCPPFEHDHEVHAVAFTPDGRHALSASDDGVLKTWEWRTGKPVCPPLALGGAGLCLAVTPDGNHVAVGGFMNEPSVFHLEDWLAPATLGATDLCAFGEIISGQRIEAGGGVTNLTAEEWLDRWHDFRGRHPELVPTVADPQAP